jgi:hypothetical protein
MIITGCAHAKHLKPSHGGDPAARALDSQILPVKVSPFAMLRLATMLFRTMLYSHFPKPTAVLCRPPGRLQYATAATMARNSSVQACPVIRALLASTEREVLFKPAAPSAAAAMGTSIPRV